MKYSLVFVPLVVAAVDVSALPANATTPTPTPTSKVNEFHLPKNHGATVPQGRPLAQQLAWQFA
ncbi:BZ3500_MvSof-1268-A1-R1_Chr7-3g09690 [Microbotryum saponariae]|uniref:BZ3500_MvSof-1268-A1-R1_Chr7-3g09690 protein n=1 Tax=Microbotryum saponariae TaxID=289078 RepID=A0A2X0L169_9BASI|nr:BZ3501_MvSof-1269-A2-R1_Chr7-2g09413 [Microbotryum saponariae]SDA02421.1 BZ3500_MvSof-1268-A1-R1_Chr7-3g09690 [Microbotryum saponariae]